MNVRGLGLVWLLFLKIVFENYFWKHIEHQKVLFESSSLLFEFSVFYVFQKKKKPSGNQICFLVFLVFRIENSFQKL